MRATILAFWLSLPLFAVAFGLESVSAQRPASDATLVNDEDLFEAVLNDGSARHDETTDEVEPTPLDRRLQAQARRERRHVLHNSLTGSVGGLRVVDAGSGAVDAFRVSLNFQGFVIGDWLAPDDHHGHVGGSLTFSWTLLEFLEVYAFTGSWRNSNWELDQAYWQVLGDAAAGLKAFYRLVPWLTVGADAHVRVPLNTVANMQRMGSATSFGIRGNLTADLRELQEGTAEVPLIARLNVGYVFDNSAALVNRLEQDRYDALPEADRHPFDLEHRHLLTPTERHALRIDRMDHLGVGLGFEAPIELPWHDMAVSPLAEWTLQIPVNRQSYVCPDGGVSRAHAPPDSCLADHGLSAFRQSLIVGARLMPPFRGLNTYAAVEIGLSGVRAFSRELMPQAPYTVLFGLSYAHDSRASEAVVIH